MHQILIRVIYCTAGENHVYVCDRQTQQTNNHGQLRAAVTWKLTQHILLEISKSAFPTNFLYSLAQDSYPAESVCARRSIKSMIGLNTFDAALIGRIGD